MALAHVIHDHDILVVWLLSPTLIICISDDSYNCVRRFGDARLSIFRVYVEFSDGLNDLIMILASDAFLSPSQI